MGREVVYSLLGLKRYHLVIGQPWSLGFLRPNTGQPSRPGPAWRRGAFVMDRGVHITWSPSRTFVAVACYTCGLHLVSAILELRYVEWESRRST
jgi:hypothetical protein